MTLKELKHFLKKHPGVTSMSLEGESFPEWPWEGSYGFGLRMMMIERNEAKFASVFYHLKKGK